MQKVGRGIVGLTLLFAAGACEFEDTTAPADDPSARRLEVFHWLFAGREADAMNDLFDVFRRTNPDIELSNPPLEPSPQPRSDIELRFDAHNAPDSIEVIEGSDVGHW